jgi:hypothetical protein
LYANRVQFLWSKFLIFVRGFHPNFTLCLGCAVPRSELVFGLKLAGLLLSAIRSSCSLPSGAVPPSPTCSGSRRHICLPTAFFISPPVSRFWFCKQTAEGFSSNGGFLWLHGKAARFSLVLRFLPPTRTVFVVLLVCRLVSFLR